jgi:hypothetical protein
MNLKFLSYHHYINRALEDPIVSGLKHMCQDCDDYDVNAKPLVVGRSQHVWLCLQSKANLRLACGCWARHHLPAGHLRVLVQLPPQQLEGQGQAPTDPQDGLLQALQPGVRGPLQPGSPPEELASRALVQHRHLVLVQP